MSIPSKMRPLGYNVEKLPNGFTRLDFLESTQGGQNNILSYIEVPTKEKSLDDDFEFITRHEVPDDGIHQEGINCGNYSFHWVWYYGQWRFHAGFDNIDTSLHDRGPVTIRVKRNHANNSVEHSINNFSRSITCPEENSRFLLPVNPIGVFFDKKKPNPKTGQFHYNEYAGLGKKWWWKFILNGKLENDLRPCLDSKGIPCMYDLITGKTFYNLGTIPFVAGVGSILQLNNLLRNLPTTGGELSLNLPAECNTPEIAESLQRCYQNKGWVLTVHEYRSSASVTYSLRRMREVIWVRRKQCEYGTYVDSTGNRWLIEHCVSIYGAHGNNPPAYGYSSFDNLEQAISAWQLCPYEPSETIETE